MRNVPLLNLFLACLDKNWRLWPSGQVSSESRTAKQAPSMGSEYSIINPPSLLRVAA